QLLAASGQPLPWAQDSLLQRGHAIEARVYAEAPEHDFLPQAGPLLLYREPHMPGVRVDSGVVEHDTIAVHYDPLIAKVIASAESRALAIERLVQALRAFPILGVRTNVPFLLRVIEYPRFRDGSIHTSFLDSEGTALAAHPDEEPPAFVRAAAAGQTEARTTHAERASNVGYDPWQTLSRWRG